MECTDTAVAAEEAGVSSGGRIAGSDVVKQESVSSRISTCQLGVIDSKPRIITLGCFDF